MNNYKNAIGYAIKMWIVGIFTTILPVIYYTICYVLDFDGKYLNILLSISCLLGGFLAAYIMKKEHCIDIKEYFRKPDLKIFVLVIATALFYALTVMYVVYSPTLKGNPEIDILTVASLVFKAIANPIGEELIYRFGMLTVLLIAAKNSRFKIMFSFIIVSVIWMGMHFSAYVPRCLEIIFVGVMIGTIYLKSKNLIYCIFFHIVVNVVSFAYAASYSWFLEREYILYISIPLFLFLAITLSNHLGKFECKKFAFATEH